MARISPALVMQVVGTFAWLLVGAMARPGAAQEPAPAAAAPSFADVVSAVEETAQPPVQPVDLSTWSGRTDVYPFSQVILESICGQPDPDTWRPLPCSTLFSEGWLEPWVPSPNGSGGAPRQGWINAADGNMYRLWFFTFAEAFNQGPKGNAYLGAYTLYTPLEPSPAPDHEHPLRAPQQRWQRVTHHLPVRADDADVEEPHDIRRYLVHAPRLAARDARLLAHGRGRGAGPDRQPAPCGEDRPDPGRRLLEQFRGPLGGPGRDR